MNKILLIDFILVILSNITHSMLTFSEIFPRTDCYRSITYPIQYAEVSHFFPTGPLYLNIFISFKIYQLKKENKLIETERNYSFVRTNTPCNSTILLTTQGIAFEEIILNIYIYLFDLKREIANFFYTFKNGFPPGRHILLSINTNFGLISDLEYFGEEYMPSIKSYTAGNFDFLQFYANIYSYICLITNNKYSVLIRPIYKQKKPNSFISNIYAVFEEGKIINVYKIAAFECDSDELNPNRHLIFFDEYSDNIIIKFYSKHQRINDIQDEYKFAQFTIPNFKRENINRRNQYPDVKKVFLVEKVVENEQYSDGTNRTTFKSSKGEIYRAFTIKNTQVTFHINRVEHINLI